MSGPAAPSEGTYELLDSGGGRKLERFGAFVVARPCAQAVWRPSLTDAAWKAATASFSREGGNRWDHRGGLPDRWPIAIDGIRFQLLATDFGHLGVFPEQRPLWRRVEEALGRPAQPDRAAPARINTLVRPQPESREDTAPGTGVGQPGDADRARPTVLNLFAYSGGATLAAGRAGARVTHVDASKGMVALAAENARLNDLDAAAARWIVDDVRKFLAREVKRGNRYDGIILDPPTFGRGAKGEVFKIERDLPDLLDLCRRLLTPAPLFLLLTCHTPGYTPIVLENVMRRPFGAVTAGEMSLAGGPGVLPIPSGTFAWWRPPA